MLAGALVALPGVLLLGACASTPEPVSPESTVTVLRVASTGLGDLVTDANGRVLYLFEGDTPGAGTSACTGDCLSRWPPALAGEAAPRADGVTARIGTIDVSGDKQVTLDGWPLHYFARDSLAGQASGQGIEGHWFVLDPAGAPVRKQPDSGQGGGY